MKKIIIKSIISCFAFLAVQSVFGQTSEAHSEFLYAIVEVYKTDVVGNYAIDIKLTNVVEKKLKTPTRTDQISTFDANYVSFQITDDQQNILDELAFKDPFKINYEYVNEEGKLDHVIVDTDMRSYIIRRPIPSTATQLKVTPHTAIRTQASITKKFRGK